MDGSPGEVFSSDQLAGATWIIREALQASRGQKVLVVHDELTEDVAKCIQRASKTHGIVAILHLVPTSEQIRYKPDDSRVLPEPLRAAIDDRLFVVVLQVMLPEVNHFRLLLLDYCKGHGHRRTASLPGISLSTLPNCVEDLPAITHRCSLLADLLVRSRNATLRTTSTSGISHELNIPINEYMPVMSTGSIASGSWGNVPSGETFIVPNEYQASGSVSLRGSILGYAMHHNEELVLDFERGKAKVRFCSSGALQDALRKILFESNGNEVAKNCSVLAELGIGTNDRIKILTGEPLFDEKVLGTVHLGLGRNFQFGGKIRSTIHNDYVATFPTLYLDEVLVVSNGVFVLVEEDVFPRWQDLPRPPAAYALVKRDASEYVEIAGAAYIRWTDYRARDPRTTLIGDTATARLAAEVLSVLDFAAATISVEDLSFKLRKGFPRAALLPVLAFLEKFELVTLE